MKIKVENNKYKKYSFLDRIKDNIGTILLIILFSLVAVLIGVNVWLVNL